MGPLRGRPAWNEVKPAENVANAVIVEKPDGWKGSSRLSSVEEPGRAEEAGGMTSTQTNLPIKGANVKKSTQTEPPADPNAHMLKDGGKY